MEAEVRHCELIVKQLGVENFKPLRTPGVEGNDEDDVAEDAELSLLNSRTPPRPHLLTVCVDSHFVFYGVCALPRSNAAAVLIASPIAMRRAGSV